MRKKAIFLSIMLLILLAATACGGGSSDTGSSAPSPAAPSSTGTQPSSETGSSEKIQITVGLPGADTHPFTVATYKFVEVLGDISGGAFDVQVFPNSQLGGEREIAEQVRMNSLDMGVVTVDGAMPAWIPEGQIFTVPYIIRDREHAYKVLDGEVGEFLTQRANEEGWENLGYWELGVRHFTNNVREIKEPEDLAGLNIRVQESRLWFALIESLNATPTPIAFNELYTALSSGVVDGQENPLPTIEAQKFYEVQKYLSLDGHTYTPSYVLFSKEKWASLTSEQQAWIQEAVDQVTPYIRNWVVEQEKKLVDVLEQHGMIITYPNVERFREATKDVPEQFADIVPLELVEKVRNTQ